jgi:hypothetical protein
MKKDGSCTGGAFFKGSRCALKVSVSIRKVNFNVKLCYIDWHTIWLVVSESKKCRI